MNDSPLFNLSPDDLQCLDVLCDEFESQWSTESQPSIEDYLPRVDERLRDALLIQLIQLEVELRQKAGEVVPGGCYVERFADRGEVVQWMLDAHFNGLLDTKVVSNLGTDPSSPAEVLENTSGDGEEIPVAIGRFQIEEELGRGAFGRVFRATDPEMRRQVAIKLAARSRFSSEQSIQMFLEEARSAARIKHPQIVSVYDIGRFEQAPFVVMEYVPGGTLADLLARRRPSFERTAGLVADVADALVAAHRVRLVHRDLKPANILLDDQGKPHVADFGMALDEDVSRVHRGEVAGTPAYMAPEQVRGETHRLDGRTDLWALGVILYESLTGHRPFRGATTAELFDDIQDREPKPPRQLDPLIPAELERICLKCLSKRMTDRFTTVADLADELRRWNIESHAPLTTTPSPPPVTEATPLLPPAPIRVIPKGLRSFDTGDADFFLALLPGPRDRNGLPDSLRFWKSRIEVTESNDTFAVGLIYGPSGCGKSSLVKAGLLPRLDQSVTVVYIEATDDEIERRLSLGLRKKCPGLPTSVSLAELLSSIRQGQQLPTGGKLLLVIDQFEQWLHARHNDFSGELLDALRQCDGGRVQAIVLVRDDFFIPVSRFFQDLEIPQLQGSNFAVVDLFDPRHARKVLMEFGRAYGCLPEDFATLTTEQNRFLDDAVNALSQDGKVISVRLALFAEMVRGKPWVPATLATSGGLTGVGVAFLEETFSASTAPPRHRLHQQAARRVLRALLPEQGTDIKGHMRSAAELRDAAQCSRDEDFVELLRILDAETRLVTPTDPEGLQLEEERDCVTTNLDPAARYYLLTHDYLVPSLRDWLTSKQKETRRGRAELKLDERAALWNSKPENRHLPSVLEWISIRTLTERQKWTEPQRKMMGKAERVIGLYSGLVGLVVVMVVCVGLFVAHQISQKQQADLTTGLVESLATANTADVEDLIIKISDYSHWATPRLQEIVRDESSRPTAKLHASLALVKNDPSQVEFLFGQLLAASPEDLQVIVSFLEPYQEQLKNELWNTVRSGSKKQRIRAAAALAQYNQGEASEEDKQWEQGREDVVEALLSVPAVESDEWIEMLRPVGDILAASLEQRFRDRSEESRTEHPIVVAALSSYLKDKPGTLTSLILLADNDREFLPFLTALGNHSRSVIPELQSLVSQSPLEGAEPADRDAFWKKQANAAVCLLELGETESVWPLFRQTPDPSLRSFLIDRIARLGAEPHVLAQRIRQELDPASRYGLVLALGQFDALNVSSKQRRSFTDQLASLYRDDPDPGVHSAAGWALRNWRQTDLCQKIDNEIRQMGRQERHWFVNSQGQTFAVFEGPVEFWISDKSENAERKKVTLSHSFAMASHEVTVEQLKQFHSDHVHEAQFGQVIDRPVNMVSWSYAVAYCNWLNEQEDIPKDQWCYEPNDQGEYAEGMKIASDFLSRTGYRLPTEEEWEFICRAGSTSTYAFGEPRELLPSYVWYIDNNESNTWKLGMKLPNPYGAFNMHRNTIEWCHSRNSLETDPTRPGQGDLEAKTGDWRVLSSGSYGKQALTERLSDRNGNERQDARINFSRLRLARTYHRTD